MAGPVSSISWTFSFFRSGRRKIFNERNWRSHRDCCNIAYPYLGNLINLPGIVSDQVPAGEEKARSRLGRYFLSDPFFRFCAGFVYPHISAFEAVSYPACMRTAHEQWNSHAGRCFEDLVREIFSENLHND